MMQNAAILLPLTKCMYRIFSYFIFSNLLCMSNYIFLQTFILGQMSYCSVPVNISMKLRIYTLISGFRRDVDEITRRRVITQKTTDFIEYTQLTVLDQRVTTV
jgi:hypothetical protein